MTDITEYIFPILDDLSDSSISDWEKVIVEIESTLSYVGTKILYYSADGKCINSEKSLLSQSKIQIIKMHRAMEAEPNVFAKWNTAKLIFEKSGKYDISFCWNKKLQDEWDK